MYRLWIALRDYWAAHKEVELGVLPSIWPVPALILAILIWDIATRETAVPWILWAVLASQVTFLMWLAWLYAKRPRE